MSSLSLAKPEHVAAYQFATGREVQLLCSLSPWQSLPHMHHKNRQCADYMKLLCAYEPGHWILVPDPDSDAFLADVLKGLMVKGYSIVTWEVSTGEYGCLLGKWRTRAQLSEASYTFNVPPASAGFGPTPNAALIAATLKLEKQK